MDIIQELKSKNLLDYIECVTMQKSFSAGSNTVRFKVCPICGHGDHFTVNTIQNYYNGFGNACNGGSIIDFYMNYNNVGMKEAIKELCKYFDMKEEKPIPKSAKTYKIIDLTSIIQDYYNSPDNDLKYVISDRKIDNDEILERYMPISGNVKEIFKTNLDLLPNLNNIDAYDTIIPAWENSKVVNCILRRNDKKSLDNAKILNLKGVEVKLFNEEYLTQSNPIIFITEGIFDCLSIECLGYKSMCLNSVNMANKLMNLVKDNISTCKDTKFVLALDNDDKGKMATEKIREQLNSLKIRNSIFSFNRKYKDINDYFIEDPEGLKLNIEDALITSFKGIDVDKFYNNVGNYITYEKIGTGFKSLDDNLKGVLPGLYVVGADTGLGKTTFLLQIADYIASTGKKVLFYSLEMSKFEMYCKSLSRIAYMDLNEKVSTKHIMFNTEPFLTERCIDLYKPISKNIEIIEGNFNLDIDTISENIEENINMIDDTPIIFVDYLQVIEPKDFKMTDKANMDYTIKTLKKISRKYFTPIFIISSLNRQSYHTDLTNTAFKESGSIEYTADVMLGLQSKIIDELKYLCPTNKKDSAQIKEIWQRYKDLTKKTGIIKTKLKCLKNRFGKKDFDIDFDFHPKINYFEGPGLENNPFREAPDIDEL